MPTPSLPTVPTASHKDISAIKHLTEHNDSNLLPPSRPQPLSCHYFDGLRGACAGMRLLCCCLDNVGTSCFQNATVVVCSSGIEEKLIIQPGSFSPELAHTPEAIHKANNNDNAGRQCNLRETR